VALLIAAATAVPITFTSRSLQDARVCEDSVIVHIRDLSYSEPGHRAGCDAMMDMLAMNNRPLLKDACTCATYLDVALGNIYDTNLYDCVLTPGIWNVLQVSILCNELELNQTVLNNSTMTVTGNFSCSEGHNCFNGKCVDGTCVCDRGTGSLYWGPSHPLWVGDDCRDPWCPQDCSGQGSCDTATGRCDCDTRFEGLACDTPRRSTQLAGGFDRTVEVAAPGDLTIAQADSQLTASEENAFAPSPSPSNSLHFIFPTPSVESDPCASIICGPNGYCDASVQPVVCQCIGAYSGPACMDRVPA